MKKLWVGCQRQIESESEHFFCFLKSRITNYCYHILVSHYVFPLWHIHLSINQFSIYGVLPLFVPFVSRKRLVLDWATLGSNLDCELGICLVILGYWICFYFVHFLLSPYSLVIWQCLVFNLDFRQNGAQILHYWQLRVWVERHWVRRFLLTPQEPELMWFLVKFPSPSYLCVVFVWLWQRES